QSLSINKQRVDLDQFGVPQQSGYQQQPRPQQNGNSPTQQHHGYGQNHNAPGEYFDEMAGDQHWQEEAQAPTYQPAPVQQPQHAANPGRGPAQNGYQRQPQGKSFSQAPNFKGARQNGFQGHQRSH
ncbi:MAG TPA: hypothetical protein PK129_09390, partial [Cellvibrionaceae bacterium]|nr:hypothetical protein [Cellvibrionaceae bacterium]